CSDEKEQIDYDKIPACIYVNPEIASIGYTEEQAAEKFGENIAVGRFPMVANGKTSIEGGKGGLFKVIVYKENRQIVGAHLYGLHVTEQIGELSAAMANNITVDKMLDVVHPHPSVNEAVGEMFLSAVNGSAIHAR
ncbi:MAG: dihydrolipoyl dehydrogenase, partial [Parasporobacterium sp.]|nr:dihydrolipoyl dehydrogenase [Parasporobacterium sp.]